MNERLKTGTTTVGLVCSDGVILAADMRATAGTMIVDKRAQKVHKINDNIGVTIAGTVSDAQLLIKLLRAELKLKEMRTKTEPSIKDAANLMGSLLYSNIRRPSMLPGIAHFLMGGKDKSGIHLYDLFPDGSVTPIRDFVASGSGSVFALGVLETQYDPKMTCEKAAELALKAINTALQRDSASGNGIDIIKVTQNGVERVLRKELVASL